MPDGSLGILTSEPTPSASLLISTTMLLTILFFRVLTITGDRIPSIGSPVVTITNCQGLIRGIFSPAVRQLTPFLSQDWGYDNNWLCPPVCLTIRVLKHMEDCLARGTLILPLWKSSFFWNVCATDGAHWSRFVIDWVYLPKFQGLFVKGKARNSLFGTRPLDFDVVALRVDFRRPRPPLCREGFCTLPYGKCDSCN